jgi:cellulose biosynthesis protein BcsQ
MSDKKAMVFHSYKGGTGKTTLIANLAAVLAKKGHKVCLIDMDLYAPSLISYFNKTPKHYINDLLSGEATVSNILLDLSSELDIKGELFVGFSNPRKEEIQNIEIRQNSKWQLEALRRFLNMKNSLFSEHHFDYLLLDTSPGIRYWSINALAAADLLFILMKTNNMDIVGTRKMIQEIYDSLTRYGSKKNLILNKVPGASLHINYDSDENVDSIEKDIEKEIGIDVMLSIPCFCEVQFNRHEFLSTLNLPNHPFAKNIEELATLI